MGGRKHMSWRVLISTVFGFIAFISRLLALINYVPSLTAASRQRKQAGAYACANGRFTPDAYVLRPFQSEKAKAWPYECVTTVFVRRLGLDRFHALLFFIFCVGAVSSAFNLLLLLGNYHDCFKVSLY